MDEVVARLGGLDVLVNNAGISPRGTAESTSESLWDQVLDTNLKGAWLGIRAALPHLKARQGTILNIGSTRATRPMPGLCAYVTSKAGLLGLTRQVAAEGLEWGVTCNMVAPGWVDTPGERMLQAAHGRPEFPAGLQNLTTAEEIGAAVVYLASPAGRKINGVILYLDAGLHIADDAGMVYLPTRGAPPLSPASPCAGLDPSRAASSAMSEFLYCLNTSTIRPTPLLDKIRIAGARRIPGHRTLERRDHRVSRARRIAGRPEAGPGGRRAEGRQHDRPAWLDHGRGRREDARSSPNAAGGWTRRRPWRAPTSSPVPPATVVDLDQARAVSPSCSRSAGGGGRSRRWSSSGSRRDQDTRPAPGRSPRAPAPPTRRWSPTSST